MRHMSPSPRPFGARLAVSSGARQRLFGGLMSRILGTLWATAALLGAAGSASAATATTTFGVSVTVNSNCLVSAASLAFPNYTPAGGNQTANTTVSVRCTKGTSFTVALNGGSTAGGTVTQRLMTNGAAGAGGTNHSPPPNSSP